MHAHYTNICSLQMPVAIKPPEYVPRVDVVLTSMNTGTHTHIHIRIVTDKQLERRAKRGHRTREPEMHGPLLSNYNLSSLETLETTCLFVKKAIMVNMNRLEITSASSLDVNLAWRAKSAPFVNNDLPWQIRNRQSHLRLFL